MKTFVLIGTTGNNLLVVQIPTAWSVEEAKKVLENALLSFKEQKDKNIPGEFVTILEENKFKTPRESPVIKICKKILKEFGSPFNSTGLTWQMNIQRKMFTDKAFAHALVDVFTPPLDDDEKKFIQMNYLDILPKIVKTYKSLL